MQEFDVIQVLFKLSSIFQRVSIETTVILNEKMLNEKST